MARWVVCLECGDRVRKGDAVPARDSAGNIVGWLCLTCAD